MIGEEAVSGSIEEVVQRVTSASGCREHVCLQTLSSHVICGFASTVLACKRNLSTLKCGCAPLKACSWSNMHWSRSNLVHVTYRGMKMSSVNVIAALVVFYRMKYVRLRWKHKRERIPSHMWGFRATPSRWAWTPVWSRTLINILVTSVVHPAPAIVCNASQQRTVLLKAIWSNEHQRPTWCSLFWSMGHVHMFFTRETESKGPIRIETTSGGGLAQCASDPDRSQCAFSVNALTRIRSGSKPVWKPSVNAPRKQTAKTVLGLCSSGYTSQVSQVHIRTYTSPVNEWMHN